MQRLSDLSAADWLTRSDVDPFQLITFGPAGFEAYGRLRYVPDPDQPGLDEADVLVPDDHPSDLAQCRIVLKALAENTASRQCFVCVWVGYPASFANLGLTQGPLVVLPYREYALFAGDLGEIDRWAEEFGGDSCPPPAFVWPADRSWCFTSDVDPHWAGIGATAAAIESLTTRTDVDVVPASPDQPPLGYYG